MISTVKLEPILDKTKTIINTLNNNKSPWESNINPELIKLAKEQLTIEIHKLINSIYMN